MQSAVENYPYKVVSRPFLEISFFGYIYYIYQLHKVTYVT